MTEPSHPSAPRDAAAAPAPQSGVGRRGAAQVIGRYALYDEFASGGMASLHFGRLYGSAGFARTVAIKRLHRNLAGEAEFVSMLVDEARLAARIRHPNVVPTLDVVSSDGELLLVMEYVHGLSLAQLLASAAAAGRPCPVPVAMAIACDVLRGLHAAHEARSELGEPLELVHRDVSPQNVLVGADGVTRVVDFGVAKAAGRVQETKEGELKGKIPYMAPEQLRGEPATRRSDLYGAGVVLWEALTGRRLFRGDNDASVWLRVLNDAVKAPSAFARGIPSPLDQVVLRATGKEPGRRYATGLEMAKEIESILPLASPTEVGAWVEENGAEALARRAELLARVEHAAAPSESSIRVAELDRMAGPTPEPPRDRRLQVAVIALAGVLAFAATALLLRGSSAETPPAEATRPESKPATELAPASGAPAGPPVVPPPVAPPPVAATPAGPPTATPFVDLDNRNKERKYGKVRKSPPADCDPPFTTDSAGRRQYKEHCL